jgi:hypothetical protein
MQKFRITYETHRSSCPECDYNGGGPSTVTLEAESMDAARAKIRALFPDVEILYEESLVTL